MSIIKTVLNAEPNSTITLFYGNQNEASIIFKKQLDDLVAKNATKLKVYHILDSGNDSAAELFRGILTPTKTLSLIENFVGLNLDNEFFVCGPLGMMDSVKKTLEDLKIDKTRVHIEYFTAPVEETKTTASNSGYVDCTATIILDGDERVIKVPAGESVLQAALDAGMDAPYACRGGSCSTCRAKLMDGKVVMDVNYALLDSEVKQGYILSCQSHPTTPTIVVDYDKGT